MSMPPGGAGGHGAYGPYGPPGGAHGNPAPPAPPSLQKPGPAPKPTAKPRPDPGPAPCRSRTGLVAQFVLQCLYIPIWALIAIGLTMLAIWLDVNSSANVGPPEIAFGFVRTGISWRRLRAAWGGRPEDWAPFTEPLLAERFAKAEKDSGWFASQLPPSGVRRATARLARCHCRGLGATGVATLAQRYGWSVDWDAHTSPDEVPLFRLMPPPAHQGVPDPYGPLPAPGAPWGPLPHRVVLPLLTLVLVPRVRTLELRRNPDAYLAHLHTYLAGKFAQEVAKSPGTHYRADEQGRILRRVVVRPWHFRGVGAHGVLRVAAEQGWRLDHTYPAEPGRALHLCRLEGPVPGAPMRR
ncbi:hypothetical protein [Streptomyces yunnanensis]|nr:hypothetical protein [Streptomyces yunnanensis]